MCTLIVLTSTLIASLRRITGMKSCQTLPFCLSQLGLCRSKYLYYIFVAGVSDMICGGGSSTENSTNRNTTIEEGRNIPDTLDPLYPWLQNPRDGPWVSLSAFYHRLQLRPKAQLAQGLPRILSPVWSVQRLISAQDPGWNSSSFMSLDTEDSQSDCSPEYAFSRKPQCLGKLVFLIC